ncbi:hypothetical protein C9374_000224 [Naegleria lovaniensis]|uniref:RING-type domain-containing protein n=1 Tax=Naegleria lovaniensis TaxID=51637 RepID=A0AA88GXE0_NAELO|nr:uncharacterized protein C9374_000224 [Naegleria lovaniensis]KAG2388785.1 hypothetical protein C9374_000224 [Naegleria lovaniensis]
MTPSLFICHGCNAQMNAIYNNEGNLACPMCGSEFVEEIETNPSTLPTHERHHHEPRSAHHLPSQQIIFEDLDAMNDDDIFSRAFNNVIHQTPPSNNNHSSTATTQATTTTRTRSSSSGGSAPHTRRTQTISITFGGGDGNTRTITRTTSGDQPLPNFMDLFNGFSGVGALSQQPNQQQGNQQPNPQQAQQQGSQQQGNNQQNATPQQDPIFQIFDMLNNAHQRQRNNVPNNFFRIGLGNPAMFDFSSFMQHIGQPFNGMTWGDYVFSDNLDDIITRMMNAMQGQGGTPPATETTISSLKTRKATAADCKDCAVCQDQIKEEEDVTELPCGHIYHKDCVVPWLQRHANCPICRSEIGSNGEALPPHSHEHQHQ